jgi:haloalkane dehalogenase
MPERFVRLVILNTFLPTGDRPAGESFLQWRNFAKGVGKSLRVGDLINLTIAGDKLPPEVLAAYDAPFPTDDYKAGVAQFPLIVPLTPDDPGVPELQAARDTLSRWDKPALVMFSDSDPILGGAARFFRKLIPTASDQPEVTIAGAGHFLQEEKGEEIAQQIHEFIERTKN